MGSEMFSYNEGGELQVEPEELLVPVGKPLFDQLNNVHGEGPGGIAAVRLPETVEAAFRKVDINPLGIVRDFAAACDAADQRQTGEIPGQRTLSTEGSTETDRTLAKLQRRLKILSKALAGTVEQALDPHIDPKRHRVVSWLQVRNHNAEFFQEDFHPDDELLGIYCGEVRTGGPRFFVEFTPSGTDDGRYNSVGATVGPMADNTVVVYRNRQWHHLGYRADPADDDLSKGFNPYGYPIDHSSDPGLHPDARRTVGLGRLSVTDSATGRPIYKL
ncbi:MAG TPA: hypothetical protein VK674_07020 [Candidatus Limnocylindria bacterium]|nr:hypothetical protein [Candidatus Limnocylindria bacterium]